MKRSLRMTETAVMLALAFILSLIKLTDMPFGGSITACSMLPVAVIAYRHKPLWGLFSGFVYSLLQLIMGLKNLTYAVTPAAAAAIIMLDYVAAFTVLGAAGIFRKAIRDRGAALAAGTLLACVLRYICHVVSGCTVWAGVSIPDTEGLIYSLVYNAAYMVPEALITVIGAYYIGSLLTVTEPQVRRVPMEKRRAWGLISSMPTVIAAVAAFIMIFGMMQTSDGFDITALTSADIFQWTGVIVTLAVGIAVTVALKLIKRQRQ